jgi:hypothetical protein
LSGKRRVLQNWSSQSRDFFWARCHDCESRSAHRRSSCRGMRRVDFLSPIWEIYYSFAWRNYIPSHNCGNRDVGGVSWQPMSQVSHGCGSLRFAHMLLCGKFYSYSFSFSKSENFSELTEINTS